jgi:teichuronic acid biosynthesis glycosyltransferase TuaC
MKIAVVTPYFPTSNNSYKGHSAFHTLRFLKRHAEIEVICPLTAYPKWLRPKKYGDAPDLAYQPEGFKTTYFEYPAIPVVTRPINGLTCARLLLPYVRSARPDLILNYWLYPEGFSAVRVGRKLRVPVIVGAIGSDICRLNDPLTRVLVRRTLMNAAGIITVSEDLRRRAIALGIPREQITTILNGCDTSVFHPGDRNQARREIGCDPDGEIILYAGNLLPSKGLGELLAAFIELLKSRPAARLALVGKGV